MKNKNDKNIKSLSLLETNKKNNYFYDRKKKRFQLCHPFFYYLLKLNKEGVDLKNWFSSIAKNKSDNNSNSVEIKNYGNFSKEQINYYLTKFLILKENGYFTEINQKEKLSKNIDAKTIERNLANVDQVVFEVTERCNLNCKYCTYGKFYQDYEERENKDMDIRNAKQLLNHLLKFWNSSLNTSHGKKIYISFYGGEPLLNYPFIEEVVDYVKQLKVLHNSFLFSTTTNGTLLHKYMDFLYENNFNMLISLDGNKTNNAYRVFKNGKSTYDSILERINLLQKKYPDYFSKQVNFIAVHHNKNSVSDIYHFFKDCFDKIPHIIGLNTGGLKESQKKEFWETYSNINQSLYESEDYSLIEKNMFLSIPKVKDLMRLLYCCNDFCFGNYNHLLYGKNENARVPTGTCSPFTLKIFLTVNGRILSCERIGHQFSLGHVKSDKVELDCEGIAEKYNNYYNKLRRQCNSCYNADICGQCIFNLNTIEDEKPFCKGFMSETDYVKYLSSFLNHFEDKPQDFSKILREVNFE